MNCGKVWGYCMQVDTISIVYELPSNRRTLIGLVESDIYDILDFYDICLFDLSMGMSEEYADPDDEHVCNIDYADLYQRYAADDIFNTIASCFAPYNISILSYTCGYIEYPNDFIETVGSHYGLSREATLTALVEADYL